jgi:hypothetical protein
VGGLVSVPDVVVDFSPGPYSVSHEASVVLVEQSVREAVAVRVVAHFSHAASVAREFFAARFPVGEAVVARLSVDETVAVHLTVDVIFAVRLFADVIFVVRLLADVVFVVRVEQIDSVVVSREVFVVRVVAHSCREISVVRAVVVAESFALLWLV